MKKNFGIFSVLFLVTLYSFAIGFIPNSFTHSNFHNQHISSQEKTISDFSSKLFSHTTPSESSTSSFNNLPVPNFKNPLQGFGQSLIELNSYLSQSFLNTPSYQRMF